MRLTSAPWIELRKCVYIKPKFYRRYIDDIFILCESREKLARFKDYFNSKHAKINCNMKKMENYHF